jgi:predicted secreted protein
MAKIAGVDVLVHVQTGTDGVSGDPIYTVLGGQSGATLNRSTNISDATSKESGGWADNVPTYNSWSIDCDGFIVEGDTALDALVTAWENRQTLKAEVRYPSGKISNGDCLIADFPEEFPFDGTATYSLSLTGNGALTTTP